MVTVARFESSELISRLRCSTARQALVSVFERGDWSDTLSSFRIATVRLSFPPAVHKYEKRRRLPPLETALACEAVFGVPIAELFAGIQQRALRNVEKRRVELKTRLQAKDRKGSAAQMRAHKLRWLGDDEQSVVGNQNILRS
jgi:hypothetical protein